MESEYNTSCGGYFTDETGIATSPNYPEHYGDSSKCEYIFEAPVGYVIHLDFTDFGIDEDDSNPNNCLFDRVSIHDGFNSSAPAIGKAMCGHEIPENVYSSGRFLTLFLHVDHISVFGHGFRLRYSRVKDSNRAIACNTNVCGGVYNNFVGCEFQSPNYPKVFLASEDCKYEIHAPKATDRLMVTFNKLSFESTRKCHKNNVTLYDGDTISENSLMQVLCDESHVSSKEFNTTGPNLIITYKTQDESIEDREDRMDFTHWAGFSLQVKLISPEVPTTVATTTIETTTPAQTTTTPAQTTTTPAQTTTTTTTTTTAATTTTTTKATPTVTSQEPSTRSTTEQPVSTTTTTTTGTTGATIASVQGGERSSSNKSLPPSAMSGLVIGVISGVLIIVLGVLIAVAFYNWKRYNLRIQLRSDDTNHLINNVSEDNLGSDVNFHKANSGGRIVRTTTSSSNRSSLDDSNL